MTNISSNNKGFTIVSLIVTLVIFLIIGFFMINRLTSSSEDSPSATELIDDAKDAVDKANDASNKASTLIDDANETVESIR